MSTISHEEMQYWQEKCSICFDQKLDFCLNHCRDQFCRACFSRYISELVKSAWGLTVPKIKCPVCYDELEFSEWKKYVDNDVVELYQRLNQPFKSITRSCPHCANEASISRPFHGSTGEREEIFEEVNLLLEEVLKIDNRKSFLEEYQQMYKAHLLSLTDASTTNNSGGVEAIYYHVVSAASNLPPPPPPPLPNERRQGKRRRSRAPSLSSASVSESNNQRPLTARQRKAQATATYSPALIEWEVKMNMWARISSLLISLETNPERWRELQFAHLSRFPRYICSSCGKKFCFQCNEPTWHPGLSCIDWMSECIKQFENGTNNSTVVEFTHPTDNDKDTNASQSTESLSNERIISRSDQVATYRWKLKNSKPCPKCKTLISREEGCNKVDCAVCSNRFCWICLSNWSDKCGFYKCRTEPVSPVSPPGPEKGTAELAEEQKPELGVPNISAIHSRRTSMI